MFTCESKADVACLSDSYVVVQLAQAAHFILRCSSVLMRPYPLPQFFPGQIWLSTPLHPYYMFSPFASRLGQFTAMALDGTLAWIPVDGVAGEIKEVSHAIRTHKATTPEIVALCKDLQVGHGREHWQRLFCLVGKASKQGKFTKQACLTSHIKQLGKP